MKTVDSSESTNSIGVSGNCSLSCSSLTITIRSSITSRVTIESQPSAITCGFFCRMNLDGAAGESAVWQTVPEHIPTQFVAVLVAKHFLLFVQVSLSPFQREVLQFDVV